MYIANFLGYRKGKRWHHYIDKQVQGDGKEYELKDFKPEQPWLRMRQATDRYLARKRGTKSIKRCDELLRKLVLEHEQKHIAIVACGHAFSAAALEDLLIPGTLASIDCETGLKTFLQCVHAVSLVSEVVSKDEGLEALRISELEDIANSSSLEALFNSLTDASIQSFVKIRMYAVPMVKSLSQELNDFKPNRSWAQAHKTIAWLSKFGQEKNHLAQESQDFMALLSNALPSWYAWARWRPNICRIETWNSLSDDSRQHFGKILDLDGPDFALYHETQGKSLTVFMTSKNDSGLQMGGSTTNECRDMAEKLLCLLERVVTHQPENRALFMCTMAGPYITKRKLELMELLMSDGYATISMKIAEAYSLRGTNPDVQRTAVQWLLELLNTERGNDLRSLFANDFATLMIKFIRDKRKGLMEIITADNDFTTNGFNHDRTLHLMQASWLRPLLEDSLPNVSECWPGMEELMTLRSIFLALKFTSEEFKTSIMDLIEYYILEDAGNINRSSRDLVKSLIRFWQLSQDWTRRTIALSLVAGAGSVTNVRCSCLEQLPKLSDSFVQSFKTITSDYKENPARACIAMADLMATASLSVDMSHWRPILHRMIVEQGKQGIELLKYALDDLDLQGWVIFLQNIHRLYGDIPNWHPLRFPAVLKPGLLEWNKKLLPHAAIIDSLRERPDSFRAILCLCYHAVYRIETPNVQAPFQQIIELLRPRRAPNTDEDDSALRVSILCRLLKRGADAAKAHKALGCLNDLSPAGIEICIRIQHLLDTDPSPYVSRTFLEAWLSEPTLDGHDLRILKGLFEFGSMSSESSETWLEDKGVVLAADYLDSEYAELLNEARRLAAMRACLKAIDLQGVTELLASIEIEDSPAVEDVLSSLSPEIVNAVEIVGDKEVEILFSLTDLTQLQRTALGLGSMQSFVLMLELCDHKTTGGRFCIHLETESKAGLVDTNVARLLDDIDNKASPWNNTCRLGGTKSPSCCSSDSSLFKRNFTIMLQRRLQESNLGRDFTSLSQLHGLISHHLKNIGRFCTECGQTFGANLRKPTTCQSKTCTTSYLTTGPKIHLSDLIQDPLATDLLLSSVYYAASSKNIDLLPESPIQDPTKIITLLDQLPSTLVLSKQLSHPSHNLNPQSLQLLSYILTAHRSYLLTASGSLKIPSLPPGTLQFVLASVAPEREASFTTYISPTPPKPSSSHTSSITFDDFADDDDDTSNNKSGETTRILFHGTNPDRLFAIICQGLRNLSNTPLQINGAVNGQGVYLADEPSTSYRYCNNPFSAGKDNWKKSEIFGKDGAKGKGYNILLGVEQAGKRVASGDDVIHVVREEGSLIVRYLFLIPVEAEKVPVARHLVPAMGSVCKGLRSGAL